MSRPSPRLCLAALTAYVPGRSIEEVREAHGLEQVIKLGSNENPLGPSPMALQAVRDAAEGMALYPDGASRELRRALARHCGVSEEQIICGNGSDEVLLLLASAFLNPGENVLVSRQTFSEYEFSSRVLDAQVRFIPLRNYCYDLEAFANDVSSDVRALFLCNPNNPTGTWFTHTQLHELLRQVPQQTLVVVDEAYGDYADAPDFPRSVELMSDFPNLVVVRTFSKLFGLAGLRLGYALAEKDTVALMAKVKMPFNVNLMAQRAAIAALADNEHQNRSKQTNLNGRIDLTEWLSEKGMEPLPSQANFLCFRAPGGARPMAEALLRRGIIVRALDSFGMPEWIRVTIGTPTQMQAFRDAVEAILSEP